MCNTLHRITTWKDSKTASDTQRIVSQKYIVYILLLDSIIVDLEERISPEVLSLFQLGVLLPKFVFSEFDLDAVREAVKIYNTLLHSPVESVVLSEFQLWVTK